MIANRTAKPPRKLVQIDLWALSDNLPYSEMQIGRAHV